MAVLSALAAPAALVASETEFLSFLTHRIGEREPDLERDCARVLEWELDRDLLEPLMELELLVEEDLDRDFLSDL